MSIHVVPLDKIPYIDNPELRINEHESTELPFRYVKGSDGRPIMPEVRRVVSLPRSLMKLTRRKGMFDLIKKDADRGVDDLL